MNRVLEAIFQRRAIKVFDPVEIPGLLREQILDAARVAPSSFNSQPYRLYWVESAAQKKSVARLCLGQRPAETASALVVAVADIGSWQKTAEDQLNWMRKSGFSPEKVSEYERRTKLGKLIFMQGWFGLLGALKWLVFRIVHVWKTIGMPPVSRQAWFKWSTKNTSLACANLMIAAEALGLNTCPMEGFYGRRLVDFLGLSSRYHEIVMVIAVGKKSARHEDQPQWRRPLETTVKVL